MIDHVVDEINAEDYDLVIIGGDMTNMGSDEELANIHRKLSRLDAPQLVVAGNHETTWSESACTRFGELWGTTAAPLPMPADTVSSGFRRGRS